MAASPESRAGKHENVEPAIVVEIDECDSAAHRLDDVVDAIRVARNDGVLQSCFRTYILEARMERTPGRSRAPKRL